MEGGTPRLPNALRSKGSNRDARLVQACDLISIFNETCPAAVQAAPAAPSERPPL